MAPRTKILTVPCRRGLLSAFQLLAQLPAPREQLRRRRATEQTVSRPEKLSAIEALTSAGYSLRRPAPVNTSKRSTRIMPASSHGIVISPELPPDQGADTARCASRLQNGVGRPLTIQRQRQRSQVAGPGPTEPSWRRRGSDVERGHTRLTTKPRRARLAPHGSLALPLRISRDMPTRSTREVVSYAKLHPPLSRRS